jgi:TonB-dependent receptor
MPAGFSNGKLGYKPDWPTIKSNTQKLTERYYAGYIMSEIDLGDMFMILPGVRYEKVTDDLNGWWQESVSYIDFVKAPGYATTATHKDDYFLPMVHFKYKPTGWLQTLFSFTQSLNRPDFNQLIPNVYMNRGTGTQSYSAGNPDLKPELWTNYDLQVACFGNEIGLISVGGFYKTVKDMIWQPTIYHLPGDAWPFGAGKYFTDNATVNISVPQNHNYEVHLKGAEFEVQTNLWYLPEPFNYISLNANLTLVSSDTKYDYSYVTTYADKWDSKGRPTHYTTSKTDSVYSNSMLNQPKQIANFSFGYNYEGFNMWLSFQYTGEMITEERNQIEFERHKMSFSRWDLQLAQKLPIPGLEVLFNYANINNPLESQNYLADSRYTYLESYGWTMDLGVRYRFSSN